MPKQEPKRVDVTDEAAYYKVKGTNLDPYYTESTHGPTREMAAEHQRLYGLGARIDGIDEFMTKTPTERAVALRPKSARAGRDVNLLALSEVADYAVTPKKKTKPPVAAGQ